MRLWRPVGMAELCLIVDSGMAAFPPRLPEQPIFYPVLNRSYAEQITREWNATSDPFVGYVTEFDIAESCAEKYPKRIVGSGEHEELWVPAEELADFNEHIVGPIRVVSAFFGPEFRGHIPTEFALRGMDARQQIEALVGVHSYAPMDVYLETSANRLSVFLNFAFWSAFGPEHFGIDQDGFSATLDKIRQYWQDDGREPPLIENGARAV